MQPQPSQDTLPFCIAQVLLEFLQGEVDDVVVMIKDRRASL